MNYLTPLPTASAAASAMAARIALAAQSVLPGLSERPWGGFRRLRKLLARRPAQAMPERLNAGALKDIGLSRSDLPAVQAGLFAGDGTRRKR